MKEKLLNYFSFESIFKFLVIILPFHVLLSVFLQYKIWIPWVWLYKEILLFVFWGFLIYKYIINNKKPIFDYLDYAIFWYIGYLIIISLIHFSGFKSIIYWWRYDFEFLLIFLFAKHWRIFLKEKLSYYLRVFLISSSIALLIWILVRFVFGEGILVYFWFSPHLSSWNFTQWVPIYHGIEWANVRRFQWIFDWPNQAAFFLILYAGLLFHYLKAKKDYLFYLYCILFIIGWLVFFTYSRSSLLWVIWGLWILLLLNLKLIFKKYRLQSLVVLFVMFILWGMFYIRYWWHMDEIILRAWSSKWHSERMIYGFKQFVAHPLWQWLASSWPWYRLSHDTKNIDEKYFIPESWYVQQLVEWWIIGFIFFMISMILILIRIYPLSKSLFFAFFAILIMNLFLHTFEASYISMLLFIFLGLFLGRKDTLV